MSYILDKTRNRVVNNSKVLLRSVLLFLVCFGLKALSPSPENVPSAMPSDATLVAGLLKCSEVDEDGETLRGMYLMIPSLAKTIAKMTETNAKLIEVGVCTHVCYERR